MNNLDIFYIQILYPNGFLCGTQLSNEMSPVTLMDLYPGLTELSLHTPYFLYFNSGQFKSSPFVLVISI